MDKVYEDTGVEQGRSVLRDLAAHPSTAKHVATKLVRYFIADEPPPELVERLAKTFGDTSGDLKEVTKALVASPEAWALPCTKLKRPSEWVVSIRLTDCPGRCCPVHCGSSRRAPVASALAQRCRRRRGHLIDGMGRRLDVANNFAERMAGRIDPNYVMETVLASTMSDAATQAVARAESRQQALALLFMSPEFQRR
jgi:uncharacterized protein (DUF1800 family)